MNSMERGSILLLTMDPMEWSWVRELTMQALGLHEHKMAGY